MVVSASLVLIYNSNKSVRTVSTFNRVFSPPCLCYTVSMLRHYVHIAPLFHQLAMPPHSGVLWTQKLGSLCWEPPTWAHLHMKKTLKQSWLPAFRKRSKTHKRLKWTLFTQTKQNKTCKFSRKSSSPWHGANPILILNLNPNMNPKPKLDPYP